MVLGAALAVGFALGAFGGSIKRLGEVKLRFEGPLLLLLAAQLALPALHLTGSAARAAYFVWLATFPFTIAIAIANRDQPGMLIIAAGLTCNGIVIALNGGMPVDLHAAAAVGVRLAAAKIPIGDYAHVIGSATTRLPILSDVLPVPGRAGWRMLASPGDVLLAAGAAVFVAGVMLDHGSSSDVRAGTD